MKLKHKIEHGFILLLCSAVAILVTPILLLWLIFELLATPFKYIQYRRSRYQQDFPAKCDWPIIPHSDSDIYAFIKERDLPIEYFKWSEQYDFKGYFLYKDILLNFEEPFFFDNEKKLWFGGPGSEYDKSIYEEDTDESDSDNDVDNGDDCLTVEAVKENCLAGFRKNIPHRECNQVVFFYRRKEAEYYGQGAVEKMQDLDDFIVYEKKQLKETILEFIQNN